MREQVDLHLDENDPEEGACNHAAIHLQACYQATFDHQGLQEHSRKFCILYAAREATVGATSYDAGAV